MADAPRLTLADLRRIVTDAEELAKGMQVFDGGGLDHLARFESRLFAEARGSGSAPYRVGISFLPGDAGAPAGFAGGVGVVKARCSCMAARTRPFCKHASALVVAWARAPESFAVSETAPPEAAGAGGARKKAVKQGKVQAAELLKGGVERASTLVRELAVAGVATLAADRVAQIRDLGLSLREHRLRRLSARTLGLASLLERNERGAVPPLAYTDAVADLLLTVRKLEKHLGGEPLEPRHVEELIGKTWRKEERTALADLTLVEYAFAAFTTPDGYVVRESRFVDLGSGTHYSEKQILPGFLAKRTEPKRSFRGLVLLGARGSVYPGYPPLRLDLEEVPASEPLTGGSLSALLGVALPSVGAALAAFQEARRDVFSPERLPVAVRVEMLLADAGRMQAIDGEDHALLLPADSLLGEQLAATLADGRLRAVLGDVALAGATPALIPRAAVVERKTGLELCPLAAPPDGAGDGEDEASLPGAAPPVAASTAAGSLAEVREALAESFVIGLTGLVARQVEPLATRLSDLGLEKPAALLRSLPARADPADRLDDFVKVYQILEMALVRLLGATHVPREGLIAVPSLESVRVRRPIEMLAPAEASRRAGRGELSRYEAAVHYAHHYEQMTAEELGASIFPTWADGGAAPFVVRALASRGEAAVHTARRALAVEAGRVARMTAIRVLGAAGGPDARRALEQERRESRDPVLRRIAAQAILGSAAILPQDAAANVALEQQLLSHGRREERAAAAHQLAQRAAIEAIPGLRNAFAADPSGEVREAAAIALGQLLDVESVDALARRLRCRERDDSGAKAAAYALGWLGDARGLDALLEAYAEGWKPTVIGEALRPMGVVALHGLLDLVDRRPDVAGKKAALDVFKQSPPGELAAALVARLEAARAAGDFVARASACLKIAAVHDDVRGRIAARILELIGEPGSKEEKALARAAAKARG